MPDPDFGRITDAKLAQARRRIGAELNPDNYLPPDAEVQANWRPTSENYYREVTADAARHFAHGYGDTNPLYCNPEYAKLSRWGGFLAPPLMVWSMGGQDEPPRAFRPAIAEMMKGDPLRGIGALQSDLHYEFYRPLQAGDRLYTRRTLVGVADKRSSWGGRAVHETRGVVTRNQRREIVHFQRGMWIRAERKPVKELEESGRAVQPPPEPYTAEQLAEIDAAYAAETWRGAEKRYWEDVEAGAELPVKVKGPLRVTDIMMFHEGAGHMFPTYSFRLAYLERLKTPGLYTPNKLNIPDIVQRMHWEEDWALKVGAPAMYDFGILRECFLCHLITAWMGDDGWLWKLSAQHRRFNYIGDTTWVKGRVTGKHQVDGRSEVSLDVWCENQRGLVTTHGTAVVLLPSRTLGPVELPAPPADDPNEVLRLSIAELATAER